MFRALHIIFYFFIILILSNCGSEKSGSVSSSLVNRTWTENMVSPAEREYCNTPIDYSLFYTISGKAEYQYREVNIELNQRGLNEIAATPRPIRHAQLEVVDARGRILQCGETDGSGAFLINVPRNEKALTLNIYSRSNNFFAKASVFRAPETNELYKLQHFFTANGDKDNISLLALGNQDLLGGAFNILDQIHNAIDKLRALLPTPIGVAPELIPKVDIYWEKGFNPGVYVGVDSGLSFFSKPQRKLFILGGLNGDVDFADTDHFDNSIILHEYFHFLEAAVSRSDSPGGAHSGNELLDPRLAWSEGAAQFFQAIVTGVPAVFDTRGNSDGDTGFALKYSIEEAVIDIPEEDGEGEFREFAVARLLWDIDDNEDGEEAPESFDTVVNSFPRFWRAFTGSSAEFSFNNAKSAFGSAGLLLEAINATSNISSWDALLTESNFIKPYVPVATSNLTRYGHFIEPCGTAGDPFRFVVGPTFFTPSPVITQNQPVTNMDHYTVIVPDGTNQNISFSMIDDGNANTQDGSLQMYVLQDGYVDFDNIIAGPRVAGANVTLGPGTYLILMLIETLPSTSVANTLPESRYRFNNYCSGGF